MKDETKEKLKQAGAIGASVLVAAGAGFGLATTTMEPDTQVKTVEVPKVVENKTTEVVEVNRTVEVPVPSDNDELFFKALNDHDGDLSFATEGLDDDEIDEVVDYLQFYYDALNMSENEVLNEADHELHNIDVRGDTLDRRDIENVQLVEDSEEVNVTDFDYRDADVDVAVTFLHEETRYTAEFRVEILDNRVEDISLLSVN